MQIVSALRGVGEAVKAKKRKMADGCAIRAREGRHTSPRGAGRPGSRTKKARANDEKTGGRRRKTRNFSTSGGAAGTKAAEHGGPPWADAKKTGERRWNRGGFRNFAPQTGHAPERRRLSAPPLRPAAPMRREIIPPRLCHLETAVRPTSPRL